MCSLPALRLFASFAPNILSKPEDKKREFTEKALSLTLSRAKYADSDGQPVAFTDIYGCAEGLYYDQVIPATILLRWRLYPSA